MDASLDGKVAVVTGAGSGIGKAAARMLADNGVRLGLFDMDTSAVEQTASEIEEAGGTAIGAAVDVSDSSQLKQAYKQMLDAFGRLDIVFANAGINGTLSAIEHLPEEDWDKTLGTNAKGTFLTVKLAIPHMKERGGSIIITSSINGNRTFSGFGMSAYSASKAAQTAFGKMAALELSNYRIRVNVICPGGIETNIDKRTKKDEEHLAEITIPKIFPKGQHPLKGRPGKPEDVASIVCFLASDASGHMSGSVLYADGAETLL
ncbi:NAD(P)-dependent dehydrogenase, short-chain alcohol dehydrogenase family [Terribacillus halophilus]|uniref:NAD(P)-dependent dehydrogenase, short-chain alcohol dehydrogenase family n=1 Tax=Terribacillus halophilus TaxID=361279 RepID=A0A1G6HX37_9BACI|nr:SDR family NAD(P)-dependent oxidoreductase [Terribacillus halophilus]SDB98405.1 NAD(P)-dependent dehydrogenase, short-chain alcohol dehydrogenase family [Terribacillus halophilus]